jgi:hypothetical protein
VNVPIQLKRVTLQNDDVPAKLRAWEIGSIPLKS